MAVLCHHRWKVTVNLSSSVYHLWSGMRAISCQFLWAIHRRSQVIRGPWARRWDGVARLTVSITLIHGIRGCCNVRQIVFIGRECIPGKQCEWPIAVLYWKSCWSMCSSNQHWEHYYAYTDVLAEILVNLLYNLI